jgi:hypothetical protein
MNKEAYLQGAGRLQFTTISPAGTGRKVYIPFYLESTTTGYQVMTPTGLQNNSTQFPTIRLAAPAANGSTATAILRTPQIPYAVMRFVGFVTRINTPAIPNNPVMDISFSDLKYGGATNLFVHEDFGSGQLYQIGNANPGFRNYPVIVAPNRMEVSVQGMALTTSASIGFSCAVLCDVLQDDEYGQHISGAYARPQAIKTRR